MNDPIPADGLGLDKAARNALNALRKETEAEAAKKIPELEPAFPYVLLPLDDSFFNS